MSRVQVWKQEAPARKTRLVLLPSELRDGPCDDQLEIVGVPTVHADENNDFIVDPMLDPDSFDAVHTFAVVRQIITMYQRALWKVGRTKPMNWQWGAKSRLKVNPRAGKDPTPFYSRESQSLNFFSFQRDGRVVHTSRSFDVVAHEVGHAVLDSLRPGYWTSWQAETGALHESFADITVILATIAQPDLCKKVVFYSKGNLHNKTFFHTVNGDCGATLGKQTKGFAAAANRATMHDASADVHSISRVFTGAMYDIIADYFKAQRNPATVDDTITLCQVGEHIAELLLKALLRGPSHNATYKDLAVKLLSCEKKRELRQIMRGHFEARKILGRDRIIPPSKPFDDIRWEKCQCCMSRTEHLQAVEKGILRGQSCLPFTGKSIICSSIENKLVEI